MVFHITRALISDLAFKFSKQFGRVLAQNIDQHIESPTVGHTDDNFLRAKVTGALHHFR